jgi:YD repeat-containing protein
MEAIDEKKQEGKDWRFVRDATGRPTGIRIMYGASAPTDRPGSV